MRSAVAVLIALASGCATAPRPGLSADEAFRRAQPPRSDASRADDAVEVALARFQATARVVRLRTPPGAPMPAAQVAAWGALLTAIDGLVARPSASTEDLSRVRLALEAELTLDRGVFGDVPAPLAERIPRTAWRVMTTVARRTGAPLRPSKPAAFRWPVQPVVLTSPWGTRTHPVHGDVRFHAGVDLLAEPSQPVRAAEAGTVVFCGWNGAHGKQVELQHDAHLATRYSHLQTVLVAPGAQVKAGDVIGLAGATGQATGPHLHFELVKDGDTVDPEEVLPAPGARAALSSRERRP
jgi:murein DD-endopeptidase MepM/ murein hydrolase activator NlpD